MNTVVQTMVSFLYTPFLLSGIGQGEYGLYQIIGSLTAYINILESMLTSSILRFYCQAKADGDQREMENVLAIARLVYRAASVIVCVLCLFCAFAFNSMYSVNMSAAEVHEGLLMLFVVCANIIVNMNYFTYSSVVMAHERFAFVKTLELIGLILQPVLVLALIMALPQALVISVVQLAISLASCIVKKRYAVRKLNCKIVSHDISKRTVMPIIGFSGIMLVSMIADVVFAKTGQLVVGYILGTGAVAIYSVGYQVYQAYAVLGRMLSTVFVPRVTELSKQPDYKKRLSDLWIKTGRLSLYIVSAILLGFGLYGMRFIDIWVGPGYEDAYWVALLMMFAFAPDIVQALGLTILQVLNRYGFRAWIYVACALANVVLSVPLIAHFGISGAAVAGLVVLLVGSGFVMNIYYWRVIGLDVPRFWLSMLSSLRGLPLIALGGLGLTAVHLASSVATLLVQCLLFVGLYVIFTYLISMNREEKLMMNGIFGKIRR